MSPFEFDRYINGVLMAEGVTIERQSDLAQAAREAARIASRGPNGEAPVLVYRPRDDENHKATVERCIAANETARTAVIYSSQVAYVSGVRKGHDRAEAALRSLIKEDGE